MLNGNIGTGDITITLANGEEVTIGFSNCSECIITFDSVTETIPQ